MLQQKSDAVLASASVTQSLRARNPKVKVANSIYGERGSIGSALSRDTASVAAPSELEFDFDNMVINSLAYRRAMAHAQAQTRPVNTQEEPPLSDLIDLTDDLTIREENASPGPLPATLLELEGLSMRASPVSGEATEGSASQHGRESAAAARATSETALVVAEREEVVSAILAVHARPTTATSMPTNLLRLEPGSEAFVRCEQCSEALLTATAVHVQFPDGQKGFHAECFHATHSCAVRPQIPCNPYQPPLNYQHRTAQRKRPRGITPSVVSSSARRITCGGMIYSCAADAVLRSATRTSRPWAKDSMSVISGARSSVVMSSFPETTSQMCTCII
jgi:hypothetical protein